MGVTLLPRFSCPRGEVKTTSPVTRPRARRLIEVPLPSSPAGRTPRLHPTPAPRQWPECIARDILDILRVNFRLNILSRVQSNGAGGARVWTPEPPHLAKEK
ncbi:hypothetical protein E2C01_063626 [Portunus trituberculatus]|uniref:Uncharacterized protein n=1 Tax=Portunus trituberculatus TaxID=210409 RepID=A0A5B7HGV7_PORTR|nr:hypothetical protein [Portunus trituberculatus]